MKDAYESGGSEVAAKVRGCSDGRGDWGWVRESSSPFCLFARLGGLGFGLLVVVGWSLATGGRVCVAQEGPCTHTYHNAQPHQARHRAHVPI